MPVVGFLGTDAPDLRERRLRAFRNGLSEAGYDEGRNVTIEFRWAEANTIDWRHLRPIWFNVEVSVIVANALRRSAAKAATTTIPIVFVAGFDPVKLGLVASLSRPGGNLTGVSLLNAELASKRLALLHELVPTATIIALLVNPANPNAEESVARHAGGGPHARARAPCAACEQRTRLRCGVRHLVRERAGALVIGTDGFFVGQSERLAALTVRHAVPRSFQSREFAAPRGLMSYAGSDTDANRLIGVYTGRILKGEKPADLPVQQSTKVELIINLKTAKALGLTVPLIMQMTADEVIE
jgi:putative ABC transport system substrate-binding protein